MIRWVIIDAGDVSTVTGWGGVTVYETSADTLRWNVAGTKTFVKFDSSQPTPSFLEGKAQLTHAEMLEILATAEWQPPFPPQP